jgi:hypothetical protein
LAAKAALTVTVSTPFADPSLSRSRPRLNRSNPRLLGVLPGSAMTVRPCFARPQTRKSIARACRPNAGNHHAALLLELADW